MTLEENDSLVPNKGIHFIQSTLGNTHLTVHARQTVKLVIQYYTPFYAKPDYMIIKMIIK